MKDKRAVSRRLLDVLSFFHPDSVNGDGDGDGDPPDTNVTTPHMEKPPT
jgi:hypothetical protein